MNERKLVGSSYIVNFYQSIYQLTQSCCQYTNLLLELKSKYGEDPDPKKMVEEELNILAQSVQTVRYNSKMFYIQYKSIAPAIKMQEDKKLEELYEVIKTTYILEDKVLTSFVIAVNKLLLNNVIKDLLITSQNLLNQIYETSQEGETGESNI